MVITELISEDVNETIISSIQCKSYQKPDKIIPNIIFEIKNELQKFPKKNSLLVDLLFLIRIFCIDFMCAIFNSEP